MRIVIDLQSCQNGSRERGIGRSSLALSKAMLRQRQRHEIVLLLNGLFAEEARSLRQEFHGLIEPSNILVFDVPGPVDELRTENNARRIAAEVARERLLSQLEPDAVFVTSMVEGSRDNTVSSVGWIDSPALQVALLHDLIPLLDPDRYLGHAPARRWYMNKVDSLRRCDLLLAVSESARSEALQALDRSAGDVISISSSVDDKFVGAVVTPDAQRRVLSRLGVTKPFLMHAGTVEPRKNFSGLLRAFLLLDDKMRAEHQLVFVGQFDDAMRRGLVAIALDGGLPRDSIVMTGHVSDDDLMALYAACRLFVYPSLHEGFGLPALEAMHLGAPVIGSNRTSIPEVLGRADALFDPTDPADIARKISEVLRNPRRERELRDHSRERRDHFSWDHSARHAIAAIESAVQALAATRRHDGPAGPVDEAWHSVVVAPPDAPPPDQSQLMALALALANNDNAAAQLLARSAFVDARAAMRWRLEGPFDSSYSLALVNRELARALQAQGQSVTLHSTEGPGDFEPNSDFLRANPDLAALHAAGRTESPSDMEVVGRNLYPPRVSGMAGRQNLLVQYAWEESGFPHEWAAEFNRHLQVITVTSQHVHKVLRDAGVEVPIAVVGNGVDHWERIRSDPTASFPGRSFRFLHVSSCFPRKGIDFLLAAWGEAFDASDDVTLVIKTFSNPHNTVSRQIAELRQHNPRFPDVELIEADLDDSQLKALFEQCHVLVAPSRAEGFGLPLAEAMLSGLPVITTAWSGQLDFCTEESAWLIDYRFAPAQSHFGLFGSVWAEPSRASLTRTLRTARKAGSAELMQRAQRGRELLLTHFSWAAVAARSIQAVRAWSSAGPRPAPRIGWVSTWNTRCGIASYSRHLVEAMDTEVVVLAPHETRLERDDETFVHRCWRSGRLDPDLNELDEALTAHAIELVVVQFSLGFFSAALMARFVDRQRTADRSVVIVLHSTTDPAEQARDQPELRLAAMAAALSQCERVVVHAVADLNRLKAIGLVANVLLMPHPLWRTPDRHQRPWPVAEDAAPPTPLIATFGFCLPHKGLPEVLEATIALARTGFPVRLRMLNAEYPAVESRQLVRQLRESVAQSESTIDVEFDSSFLDDGEIDERLAEADLVVFAYQDTQESASGAVRHAMAAHRPVLVTPLPIFDDLGDAVHRSDGSDAASLAAAIRRILAPSGTAERQSTEAQAARWREAHEVDRLAPRLLSMLKGLWADRARRDAWHIKGSSRMLRTAVGRVDKRTLVTTGVDGMWLFGPYIPLRPGRHRLSLDWEGRCAEGSPCTLRIVCAGASVELDQRQIVPAGPGRHRLDVEFDNALPRADLEIQIEVPASAELRLHGLSLASVAGPSPAEADDGAPAGAAP
jgi:glycosyltransferase involved in cell wall biosynthesis